MPRPFALTALISAAFGGMGLLMAQAPPRELPPAVRQENTPSSNGLRTVSGSSDKPILVPTVDAKLRRPAVLFDQFRDAEVLNAETLHAARSARIGMDWLFRVQQPNGLFLAGYNPALNQSLEGDNLLRQATAAYGLAHAARVTGEAKYAARASQVILALIGESSLREDGVRIPKSTPLIPSRLAYAGMLVRAVHALPEPAADLVSKADELALFLRASQQADGSFADDASAAGLALYGLVASHKAKPADWKLALLRSAGTYYRNAFRGKPSPVLIGWMGPAYGEAFQLTREVAFAEFAFEMNDWLCGLQCVQDDPRLLAQRGGFRWGSDAKNLDGVPSLDGALAVTSLSEAYSAMQKLQNPDANRREKYKSALNRAAQFLESLQYGEDSTRHYAPEMRAFIAGAFHQSPVGGDIRSDQSAIACVALTHYLASGVDR